jgi:hypothetical protein
MRNFQSTGAPNADISALIGSIPNSDIQPNPPLRIGATKAPDAKIRSVANWRVSDSIAMGHGRMPE